MVAGPFANLSDDFTVLCDYLGRLRAFKMIHRWQVDPDHALAFCRYHLVQHFGSLVSLLWARLILRRLQDGVVADPSYRPRRSPDSNTDDIFESFHTNPCRGAYRGKNVPGTF